MLRVSQVKLKVGRPQRDLEKVVLRILGLPFDTPITIKIVRRSIDAREGLFYCYTLDVQVPDEDAVATDRRISRVTPVKYRFPVEGMNPGPRPIIVGFGPAGIFAALLMAEAGMRPIVIEQGADIETRTQRVDNYWQTGELDVRSNVQFGEGGAGTFSDGKLNTNTKDNTGRNRYVLETLVKYGAPEDILIDAMPHIGTDKLRVIVPAIRGRIEELGGEVHFLEKMEALILENNRVKGIVTDKDTYETDALVLAIGHSSRDTYYKLLEQGVEMCAKPFACGFRIQHPQSQINQALYGLPEPGKIGPAPYKLTYNTPEGRGVYSFCMCPGGCVVDSSSEPGQICVNGMSYSSRAGINANSAIVVSVTPEDYGGDGPLAGIEFQRRMEARAYQAGNGAVPVQTLGDYCRNRATEALGAVEPEFLGRWALANLRGILPQSLEQPIVDAIKYFGSHRIRGFDRDDALLAGVEARTSSPVRIIRNDSGQSINIEGLFPAGEGAGYAGGITSAAMDGIKAAENVAMSRKAIQQ